jgi:hypothetical protein
MRAPHHVFYVFNKSCIDKCNFYFDDWLTVHRSITLVGLQLDAQNSIYLHIIKKVK